MMNGIDISSWQEGIDIAALTTTDFVIVKATQGTGYKDPTFNTFLQAALKAGKKIGAYHYANGAGWQAEADHFLSVVKPYLGKIMLALDWETGSSNAAKNSAFDDPGYAKKWLDYVREKTGTIPMIYMSQSVAASKNWSEVYKTYPLWGAQYANYNRIDYTDYPWSSGNWGPWGAKPTMDQYTSSGKITGYSGNLDLNLYYGDAKDWDAMCGGKKYKIGWNKDSKGWWYAKSDNSYAVSEWLKIDGEWYYFDANGYMAASQWTVSSGKPYYLGANGQMVRNMTVIINEHGQLVPAEGYYHLLGDVPEVYRAELDKLVESGKLKGKGGAGENMVLDMSEEAVRVLIIANR